MTLKIEKSTRQGLTVLKIIGRITREHIGELEGIFDYHTGNQTFTVDLQELKLVDREAVRFFVRCEAMGINLENCPAYIRQWMERERD
jgi:arginine decarboxylase-like protein